MSFEAESLQIHVGLDRGPAGLDDTSNITMAATGEGSIQQRRSVIQVVWSSGITFNIYLEQRSPIQNKLLS